MSMNFNGSKPEPVAPKKNNRHTIGIIIAVVFATVGAIGIIHQVQIMQDNMERVLFPSSSYQPSAQEVRERCIETLRDMLDSEPPKLSVNICVGTVLGELNK